MIACSAMAAAKEEEHSHVRIRHRIADGRTGSVAGSSAQPR